MAPLTFAAGATQLEPLLVGRGPPSSSKPCLNLFRPGHRSRRGDPSGALCAAATVALGVRCQKKPTRCLAASVGTKEPQALVEDLELAAAPERPLRSVRRLRIKEEEVSGFVEDFFAAVKTDEEFLWNAMTKPRAAEAAVCRSFKRAVRWLPEEVLNELMRLFVDPSAPAALWISGLPIDPEIPPTPALPGDFRLPICEAWLLGVARILGVPYGMLGFYTGNARGGLIRDLAPKPGLGGINNPHIDLGFHRDVPAAVTGASSEPDGFLLLAARGDPGHHARTLICSNRLLAAHLTPSELAALRRSPVRTTCLRPGGQTDFGRPFLAAEGSQDDPKITLFYIPEHKEFTHEIISDDPEAKAAYERCAALAAELCDSVDLQAGDLLVINNARCNHARTAFEPQLDGNDRWLLKTFVNAFGWQRPSQLGGGASPLVWPQMLSK